MSRVFGGLWCLKAPLVGALAVVALALPASAVAGGGLQVSPHHHNFGDVPVGTFSSPADITVTNTAKTTNTPDLFQITGGQFFYDGTTCGTLQPGASCDVFVVFGPSVTGNQRGDLTIFANFGSGGQLSVKVALAGTGV
jgi:hypothetical protein